MKKGVTDRFKVSAKYCYAAHESRLHQNDRCVVVKQLGDIPCSLHHAASFLQGFRGYLETDGYQGYNDLPDIKRCSCWAHVRRYFTDAIPKGALKKQSHYLEKRFRNNVDLKNTNEKRSNRQIQVCRADNLSFYQSKIITINNAGAGTRVKSLICKLFTLHYHRRI